MLPVSVVINTLNEEATLPGCLETLKWADEVVVVDMHSDDRTAEIAARAGCKVLKHERVGYVEPARNFAVAQARNRWVLVVDADERVSPGLAEWIRRTLSDTGASAFRIPRRNFYGRTWMRCCGWFPDEQLRLFRRDVIAYSDRIHRAPRVNGVTQTLPIWGDAYLEHLCFSTLESRFEKDNKYSGIAAQTLYLEGRRAGLLALIVGPLWAFLRAYLLQRGFLAGRFGVVLAWERAFAIFMRQAKVWEREQGKR
jgi:glycosyltransferase involved in cell wall biosynthesis